MNGITVSTDPAAAMSQMLPVDAPPFEPTLVPASVEDWVSEITQLLARQKASSIELGKLLHRAKRCLRYGEWSQLWQSGKLALSGRLLLSKRKAEMLVVVGKSLGNLDAQSSAQLPAAWNTLYYLALLDHCRLLELIREEIISPSLTLREAKELLAQFNGQQAGKHSRKSIVRQRLLKFAGFMHTTLRDWTPAERNLARTELSQLVQEISDAALNHPWVVAPRSTLSVDTFSGFPSISHQPNSIALG